MGNFAPESWLTGWDNLHPEFNFGLNIKRSLFAVWQEYQGLGLLGGMGHASDLPRQVFLFLLSLIFPDNWLRQIFMLLMLLVGTLGIHFLLKKIILKDLPSTKREIASTGGALFYLLNLATIQTFYTPFSSFVVHFGLLPWLFYAALLYLKKPKLKSLLLFTGVNIAAVPQSYVPTVFLVYLFALFILLIIRFLQSKKHLLTTGKILLFTFIINSFWLLPFLYFVINNSHVTFESKINQMSTEDAFLKNKEYGNFIDVALLRGFWFSIITIHPNDQNNYLFSPWIEHFNNPIVTGVGLLTFISVLIGIVYSFIIKNEYRFIFLILFLVSFTILANNTFPFSFIDSLFYSWPLFAQVFRFPYTKFSILAAFSYSIFFAFALSWATKYLPKMRHEKIFNQLIILPVVSMLIFLTLPVFAGNLFYKGIQVKIPEEYLALQRFFRTENPNERTANFPQHTYWGWNFYKWGYLGSGFLWYGAEQPIIDRAFDVWSDKNENYYWEISYAMYSKNQNLFENVFDKYQIRWLVIDKNIVTSESKQTLFIEEIEEIANNSGKFELKHAFGNIKIYRVNIDAPLNNFVFAGQNLPTIGSKYKWNNNDTTFSQYGHYINNNKNNAVYYPFKSLFSGRDSKSKEFEIEETNDTFYFKASLPKEVENYIVSVPNIDTDSISWINPQDLSHKQFLYPDLYFDGKNLTAHVPKITGYLSAEIDPHYNQSLAEARNCASKINGEVKNEVMTEGEKTFLRLSAKNANNCSSAFWLSNLPHDLGYLVSFENRNKEGKSLLFWIENPNLRRVDLETYLPRKGEYAKTYFIHPPMEQDGIGYVFHFDSISIGNEKSINDLGKITINPIPYQFLTNIILMPTEGKGVSPAYIEIPTEHKNPGVYKLNIEDLKEVSTLILSQAYDKGWVAYKDNGMPAYLLPLFGEKIGEHVLVNNWQNGWNIDPQNFGSNKRIVIVYWPQLLEFLGFGLFITFGVGLIICYFLETRSLSSDNL